MRWRVGNVPVREPEPIATAPRDGRPVRVLHGPLHLEAMAYWNPTLQGWVRVDDELLRALRQVTAWFPR
jgi:hypothetical protein